MARRPVVSRKPGKDGDERYVTFNPFEFQLPKESKVHYTPWLVVRYAAGDDGTRPVPGGSVFWESPDVWVVPPAGSGFGVNQPVVGQPNAVFARVTNYGLQQATGVFVEFSWSDPSIGIGPATSNLIGVGAANIPSGWSVIVQCPKPWIPVWANGGHECLFAHAFIPVQDPVTAPFTPWADRHVGQKNEQLVTASAGQNFSATVQAINAADAARRLTIEVQQALRPTIPPLLAARTAAKGIEILPPTLKLPVSMQVGTSSPARTRADKRGSAAVVHTSTFKPKERRAVQIKGTIPANAKPGQTFTFRVVQRSGDKIEGGYTINALVVAER